MIYAINQPHFFPYVGFFSLLYHADKFIFFDTPQYKTRGWMNRVKILRADGKPDYIIVPIAKHHRNTSILDARISNVLWKERIYGQLAAYKKKAPRYQEVMELVHDVLDRDYGGKLSCLAIESVIATCAFIDMPFDYKIFSELDLTLPLIKEADEWTLEITRALHGNGYVNLPNGQSFYKKEKFRDAGIKINFIQSNMRSYDQKMGHFEPGLSILDMLMFCDNEEVVENIKDYNVI